ncbi:MAG: hypothetical protein R3E02_12215 [Blastomonas sp.]
MNTLPKAIQQFAIVIVASLSALTMFSATTAHAQTGGYFRAELASPVEKTVEVVNGVVWRCEGTSCTGTKSTSRPVNACARLARKVGEVTAFTVRGDAMDAEDLTSCNN